MSPALLPQLPTYLIGTSLKMYFTHARTLAWVTEASDRTRHHPLVASGQVGLFVMPQFPSIPACLDLAGPFHIGAQNLASEDFGAWTGEVSGAVLAEIGARFVEVGHAERRQHFHETDAVVKAKTAAAFRHGLVPVLCVGETQHGDAEGAAAKVLAQIHSALTDAEVSASIVIAYEPVWAIGAPQPADPEYIQAVTTLVRSQMRTFFPHLDARLIYGGSAGPGLLSRIGSSVDGLFLGRFAHEPDSMPKILAELAEIVS